MLAALIGLAMLLVLALPAAAQRRDEMLPIPPGTFAMPPPHVGTPATTGVPACDRAATAWRRCVEAAPKTAQDRAYALSQVDSFMRAVADSTGAGRAGYVRSCPATAQGYETMLRTGVCAENTTGLRDETPRARDMRDTPAERLGR